MNLKDAYLHGTDLGALVKNISWSNGKLVIKWALEGKADTTLDTPVSGANITLSTSALNFLTANNTTYTIKLPSTDPYQSDNDSRYLKLAGGTMTGHITIAGQALYFGQSGTSAILSYNSSYPKYGIWYCDDNVDKMMFSASGNGDSISGADLCINGNGDGTVTIRGNSIWHSGNLSPMTTSHPANGITSTNISNWNSVYEWFSVAANNDGTGDAINKWKELEAFLTSITDNQTLSGLLAGRVAKSGDTMTGALTTPGLTVTGAATFSQAINGSILGNAATASRLQNARNIAISGAVTGNANFDGSGNITISTSVNHTHSYAGSSSAGGAATNVVVNSGNNSASTYPLVWHSGNTLYSTSDVYVNPSTDVIYSKGLQVTGNINGNGSGGKFRLGNNSISTRSVLLLNSNAGNPADVIFRSGSYTDGTWGDWAISSRGGETNNSQGNSFCISRGVLNGTTASEAVAFKIDPTSNKIIIGSSIFTTTPSYQLHVVGDIYSSSGFVKGSSSNDYVLLGGGGHKPISEFTTLSGEQTITGNKTFSGSVSIDDLTVGNLVVTGGASFAQTINGNAATASKLATARTISLTGSVTGSGTFDGSGNLSITTTTNHTHEYFPYQYILGDSLTSAVNLNTITYSLKFVTVSWSYSGHLNVSNSPWSTSAGNVFHLGGLYPMQIASFYNTSTDVYIRTYYAGNGWKDWKKIAFAGEALPASDVYAWAKASTKPSYNLDEISDGNTYNRKYPYGFNGQQSTNNWLGVSGLTLLTAWQDTTKGGEVGFWTNGAGQMYVGVDGFFYQRRDFNSVSRAQRVLDEYDISHTKWGDSDTLDGYDSTYFSKANHEYELSPEANITFDHVNKKFTKIAGGSDWNTQAYSISGYKECRITYKIGQTNAYIMVGLNSDPTSNASYNSIDYCWYPLANGNLCFYENGTQINSISGHTSYSVGDEFVIEYSNNQVRYYHNGVLCRTVERSYGVPLYFDSSLYTVDGYIYDVVFEPIHHSPQQIANQSANATYTNAALQIREANYTGAGSDSWGQAPRLTWHWGDRVQTQIGLASNNELYLSKNNFTNAYKLVYENSGTWGISISGNSTTTDGLRLYQGSRQTLDNIILGDGKIHYLIQGDGSRAIHFSWDSGNYDTQIYVPDHRYNGDSLKWRSYGNTAWESWITILDSSNYSSYAVPLSGGTMTGALTVPSLSVTGAAAFSQAINGSILGNAATASRLLNARNIAISGAVTGNANFDGSGNITISTSVNHTHNYAGSSSAGGAATNVVVNDSNSNSTYRMVWHSGNTMYSTDNIYCNPSTDVIYSKGLVSSGSITGNPLHLKSSGEEQYINFFKDTVVKNQLDSGSTGFYIYSNTNGSTWRADMFFKRSEQKIGVGTIDPENTFDVNGIQQIYQRGNSNTAFKDLLLLKQQNSTELAGDNWNASLPTFGIGFRRYWTSNGNPYGETTCAGIYATVSSNWRGGLVFRTKNNETNGGTHDITALRLAPSGYATFGSHIEANGLIKSTYNGNTVTIGSQNTSWCHIQNSANISFYFNRSINVDGELVIYGTSYKINNNTSVLNDLRVYGGDLYIGSASGSQCHQQYDTTNKCLKFYFD